MDCQSEKIGPVFDSLNSTDIIWPNFQFDVCCVVVTIMFVHFELHFNSSKLLTNGDRNRTLILFGTDVFSGRCCTDLCGRSTTTEYDKYNQRNPCTYHNRNLRVGLYLHSTIGIIVILRVLVKCFILILIIIYTRTKTN